MRAVLAELADFVVLEHAEAFAGVIGAHHVGGIEDVAQLIAIEAVEVGIEGIEFGSSQNTALAIEEEKSISASAFQSPGVTFQIVGW